jgi:hypothetical protein
MQSRKSTRGAIIGKLNIGAYVQNIVQTTVMVTETQSREGSPVAIIWNAQRLWSTCTMRLNSVDPSNLLPEIAARVQVLRARLNTIPAHPAEISSHSQQCATCP